MLWFVPRTLDMWNDDVWTAMVVLWLSCRVDEVR